MDVMVANEVGIDNAFDVIDTILTNVKTTSNFANEDEDETNVVSELR